VPYSQGSYLRVFNRRFTDGFGERPKRIVTFENAVGHGELGNHLVPVGYEKNGGILCFVAASDHELTTHGFVKLVCFHETCKKFVGIDSMLH
jgi:hypothetical protein